MPSTRRSRATPIALLLACAMPLPAPAASVAAPAPAYALSAHIGVGAGARWDYITFDVATDRIYLAHAEKVEIVDARTRQRVGAIAGLHRTHGIAIAAALGRGYISDGKGGDAVVVFDLRTLAVLQTIPVGGSPDAIVYDPRSRRVVVLNRGSRDASIIDAASGAVVTRSLPLGGAPEFARADGQGHVYLNIDDTAEIAVIDVIDVQGARVQSRYSIAPCDGPSGLAIEAGPRLLSVCDNKLAVLSDPVGGKVLGTAAIGEHPDGAVFDDGFAFSANGGDGTISVISADPVATAATIVSRRGARTIDVDPRSHALYLPALAHPPAADAKGVAPRPQGAAPATESNELEILVYTRR